MEWKVAGLGRQFEKAVCSLCMMKDNRMMMGTDKSRVIKDNCN